MNVHLFQGSRPIIKDKMNNKSKKILIYSMLDL